MWVEFKEEVMIWAGKKIEEKAYKQSMRSSQLAHVNQADAEVDRMNAYKAPVYTFYQRCGSKAHLIDQCPDKREDHKCTTCDRVGHATKAYIGKRNKGPPPPGGWPQKQQRTQQPPAAVTEVQSTTRAATPGFSPDGEYNDPSYCSANIDEKTDRTGVCTNTSSHAYPHPHAAFTNSMPGAQSPQHPLTNCSSVSETAALHALYPNYAPPSGSSASIVPKLNLASRQYRDASRCLAKKSLSMSADRVFKTNERKPQKVKHKLKPSEATS
jgi:hypothetical protein